MTKNFNPENGKISMDIGIDRKNWIHERAQAQNPKLTDTQYLCSLIDMFKEVFDKNAE